MSIVEFKAEAVPAWPGETTTTVWKGFTGHCPACGTGRMFRTYLKVADTCPRCGEELHHHRADDFPAYLVIIIVGHIVVPLILAMEIALAPPMWLSLPIWLSITGAACIALLQPVKGAVVALQWHLRMHGFEESRKKSELQPTTAEAA